MDYVFPQDHPDKSAGKARQGGMTLRDYFAVQAIGSALVAGWTDEEVARRAYHIADALLEARIVRASAGLPEPGLVGDAADAAVEAAAAGELETFTGYASELGDDSGMVDDFA